MKKRGILVITILIIIFLAPLVSAFSLIDWLEDIDFKDLFTGKITEEQTIDCAWNTDCQLNTGDTALIDGNNIKLSRIGTTNAIIVEVNGIVETISLGQTKTVNNIEIKNKEADYAQNTATIIIIQKETQELITEPKPTTPITKDCAWNTDCQLNTGDTALIDGNNIKLSRIGTTNAIIVEVNGIVETISLGQTKTVNNIEIKNKEADYAQNTATIVVAQEIGDDEEKVINITCEQAGYICGSISEMYNPEESCYGTGGYLGNSGLDGSCGNMKYCCKSKEVEITDISISVATSKDTYEVNEIIELTDPPDELDLNDITGNIVNEDIINNIRDASLIDKRQSIIDKDDKEEPIYKGYIIQFEEKSVLEKKIEIEKSAKQNEESFLSPAYKVTTIVLPTNLEPNLDSNIEKKVKDYKTKLSKNLEKNKQKILTKLIKNNKITGSAIKTNQKQIEILLEFTDVFNGISLDISNEEAEEIKKIKEVKNIYPNYEIKATLMDSVPLINADDIWKLDQESGSCTEIGRNCLTGKGMNIAIIDTGIDYIHPDLGGCFGNGCKVIGGYDFVNHDNDPIDDYGHGTHVAAIAAGNGILKGVAPDANLYAYKVLNQYGTGFEDTIIAGIERAIDPNQDGNFDDHVDIISMSLGGIGEPHDPQSQAIDNAVENGVVVVVAAGNNGVKGQPYLWRSGDDEGNVYSIASPAIADKAITVGATYKKDYQGEYWDIDPKINQITGFSSTGPGFFGIYPYNLKPDIVAPGALICAARYDNIFPEGEHPYYKPCIDDEHVLMAGTSMATPIIAGAVALLKQAHPDWEPYKIKSALMQGSTDLGKSAFLQGAGLVNLEKSLNPKILTNPQSINFNGLNLYEEVKAEITLINPNKNPITINIIPEENNDVLVRIGESLVTLNPNEERTIEVYAKEKNENEPNKPKTGAIKLYNNDFSTKINYLYYKSTEKLAGELFRYHFETRLILSSPAHTKKLIAYDINNDNKIDLIEGFNGIEEQGGLWGLFSFLNFYINKGDNLNFNRKIIYRPPIVYDYEDDISAIRVTDFDNNGKKDILIGGVQGIVRVLYDKQRQNVFEKELKIGEQFEINNYIFKLNETEIEIKDKNNNYISYNRIPLSIDYFYFDTLKVDIISKDQMKARFKFTQNQFESNIIKEFGQTAYGVAIADYNNDGYDDFIVASSRGNVIESNINLFENNKDGTFTNKGEIYKLYDTRINDLEWRDIDNDNDLDIIFSYNEVNWQDYIDFGDAINDYGLIAWAENKNSDYEQHVLLKEGERTKNNIFPEFPINMRFTINNFNNDNNLDIAYTTGNGGKLKLLKNKGQGNFENIGEIFDYGNFAWGLSSADFDDDKKIDLVIASSVVNIPDFQSDIYLKKNFLELQPPLIPESIISRPESKIVNNGDKDIFGELSVYIQEYEDNNWGEYSRPFATVGFTIKSGEVIKLDKIFNPKNIKISESGKYKIVVEFKNKKTDWEFNVI